MRTFTETFESIKSVSALVVGDFFLDIYTKGSVNRISPEAPVPILLVSEVSQSPGGAGNLALNMRAMGARISVLGRIGSDNEGRELNSLLQKSGINTEGLVVQEGMRTGIKNRFIAAGQQLMRSDYEKKALLPSDLLDEMKDIFLREIKKFDLIIISDYGKGVVTQELLKAIIPTAKRFGVRVIVDPKGKDFKKYNGTFLIKPNNQEAYAAANLDHDGPIELVGETILREIDVEYLLITRAEKGMIFFSRGGEIKNFSVQKKEVIDVSGAGDTALAMLGVAIASGLSFDHAIELANLASSIAIEEVGCAIVTLSEIAQRLLHRDPKNKVFNDRKGHFVLNKMTEEREILFFKYPEESSFSSDIFQMIRFYGENKKDKLFIIEIAPDRGDLIDLLSSLNEVDIVFASNKSFKEVCPHHVLEILERVHK